MSFKNIRFPTAISYGSVGGPGFKTDIIELDSGHEARNQNWSAARCSFDVAKPLKTDQMRKDLLAFIRIVKGRTYSFKFRDPSDYIVASGEGVLSSLGSGQFQLYKRYTLSTADVTSPTATETQDRLISLPVTPIIKQGLTTLTAGVHYILNEITGIITAIGSPTPAPDSWTGEFDIPCRFENDQIRFMNEDLNFFRTQNISVVEVRPEEIA